VLDYQTIYEVGMSRRDDLLRQAAADVLADDLPRAPSVLRRVVSGWLYALAAWLESRPSATPAQVHAR
jgi:hypothetical protein